MALPTSSLAKICNVIREHVATLGAETSPADWDVSVTIGAPGANLAASNSSNTLNLFFYRFEPFGFNADARPGDVQWIKVFCIVTAFGVDEDTNGDDTVDFSAGFNELRMLSQVMRLFQEQPVMLIEGADPGEQWHTQFVPRPLADEQINQIWSTQGETIYRPSVVYEIALAPIEPLTPEPHPQRVGAIGIAAAGEITDRHGFWPTDRDLRYPAVPAITIDAANPQWAPAIAIISGAAAARRISLSLNLELPVSGDNADFSSFPEVEIWLAGDTSKSGDITFVGQLLQNPEVASSAGNWQDINAISGQSADVPVIDPDNLPASTSFNLLQAHWTGIDNSNHSWQLQLFAERHIRLDPVSGQWQDSPAADAQVRIRSNPVLITLTREVA